MPRRNWNNLSSIDYHSLSFWEREEFRREAIRRAHAARAEMMNAVLSALPRLIGRAFARLTRRKHNRRVTIPGRTIAQV